jgi:hypothetical protein
MEASKPSVEDVLRKVVSDGLDFSDSSKLRDDLWLDDVALEELASELECASLSSCVTVSDVKKLVSGKKKQATVAVATQQSQITQKAAAMPVVVVQYGFCVS